MRLQRVVAEVIELVPDGAQTIRGLLGKGTKPKRSRNAGWPGGRPLP